MRHVLVLEVHDGNPPHTEGHAEGDCYNYHEPSVYQHAGRSDWAMTSPSVEQVFEGWLEHVANKKGMTRDGE